ncbi:MAG: hypothetical protein UY74_C0055G0002 [Candidatus Kaiserbacteria bacterium GW2011_GWC2_52_8b]|uniref:Uncharacterized protein n=1 Tax=Candidatus Kaiserbacteria bacterium GW2011_GWC2_52_8b TaxID=1618676 RepID=A0A0G2AC70_9BACT|nr:MAG: hypothetical protein UY74_C0055G0002 [Candidatus Kaiserbacteria bacterium GW2011_GWC2_52_8b]
MPLFPDTLPYAAKERWGYAAERTPKHMLHMTTGQASLPTNIYIPYAKASRCCVLRVSRRAAARPARRSPRFVAAVDEEQVGAGGE